MTGHDFLRLAAKEVEGAEEVEWRSGISRGYYAAFHVARDLFRALRFQVPRADAAHMYLSHRLQNCGHDLLEEAGRDLHALRQRRNAADYDLDTPVSQTHAHADVGLARDIISALAVLASEPTRTAVRDTIRAYERDVLQQVTWKP